MILDEAVGKASGHARSDLRRSGALERQLERYRELVSGVRRGDKRRAELPRPGRAQRREVGISSPAPAQGDRQGRPEIRPALPDRSGDRAVSLMSYKGYEAVVEYDPDADLFHGAVINLRDVVTFQGRSVSELKRLG